MVKQYESLGKVGLELEFSVSARGEGLCLSPLPRKVAEVHNLVAGDRVKVVLGEHFRKVVTE